MFILGNITSPTAICQVMTLRAPITLDCQPNTLQVSDQHLKEYVQWEAWNRVFHGVMNIVEIIIQGTREV